MTELQIERFFENYAERYMASDVDAIAAMYETPLLAVREGKAIHLGDDEAVRNHFASLMAAYRKAGAKRAAISALSTVPLGRSSLLTTVRWSVQSDDGTVLRDFATSYHMLRREDGGWRILSYVNHDD